MIAIPAIDLRDGACVQLVGGSYAEERIRLDDPIDKYVPEISRQPLARATIHELLTHTSGAPDYLGARYEVHHLEMKTLADYIRWFGTDKPLAAPGQRFAYSNFGYLLLGRLVERVTRGSYYDYVRDVVFMPAGMSSSGFEPGSRSSATRARSSSSRFS